MTKQYKRIREWMDIPGKYQPGEKNSITDVKGVMVGHFTLCNDNDIHTGVTIIKPHDKDVFLYKCPCAAVSGNGFGKLAGTQQIEELGELESLIGLTNTLSVGQVMQGILDYHIENVNEDLLKSINIVVGETNDSYLNNIRSCAVKPMHVREAIKALSEDVKEGAVGAGAGTICFGYKGGIGTASRIIPSEATGEDREYTIAALVQTNYGGNLNIYGHQIEKRPVETENDKGSCMIILATDAPVDARQLKRIARRGLLGLACTGSYMGHGSGDFCISFSNYEKNLKFHGSSGIREIDVLSDEQLSPFFNAVVEAVTEALYNSMTMAGSVTGSSGHYIQGINLKDFSDVLPLKGIE